MKAKVFMPARQLNLDLPLAHQPERSIKEWETATLRAQ